MFKALITPAGDQLNLYLKSFGIAGKPPQYDSYITSVFSVDIFLRSLTSKWEKKWSIPGSKPTSLINTKFSFFTSGFRSFISGLR